MNATGVTQDFEKAAQWFQKAADQEDVCSQFVLRICYMDGIGVTQDFEKAVQWFQKAADQKDMFGQYGLGLCYMDGKGVTQDFEKAAQWFQKAADQGYEDARPLLEDCRRKTEAAKTKK